MYARRTPKTKCIFVTNGVPYETLHYVTDCILSISTRLGGYITITTDSVLPIMLSNKLGKLRGRPGPLTGGQLGHFALDPTMLGTPRARQGAFSDFAIIIIKYSST